MLLPINTSLYIPGHAIGSIHLPFSITNPSGQKQPSAHPPGQSAPILSQVRTHSGPHC